MWKVLKSYLICLKENLYNSTSSSEFNRSKKENIMKFYDTLKKNNIEVTIRKEMGKDIKGACGQLRANYLDIK